MGPGLLPLGQPLIRLSCLSFLVDAVFGVLWFGVGGEKTCMNVTC